MHPAPTTISSPRSSHKAIARFTPHFALLPFVADPRRAKLSQTARDLLTFGLWSAARRGDGEGCGPSEAMFWGRLTGPGKSLSNEIGASYGSLRRALTWLKDQGLVRLRYVWRGELLPGGRRAEVPNCVMYLQLDTLRALVGLDPMGTAPPAPSEPASGVMARASLDPITLDGDRDGQRTSDPIAGDRVDPIAGDRVKMPIPNDSAVPGPPPDLDLKISLVKREITTTTSEPIARVRETNANPPSPSNGGGDASLSDVEKVTLAWWVARGRARAQSDSEVPVGNETALVRRALERAVCNGETAARCLDALSAACSERVGGSSWRWLRDHDVLDHVIWSERCLPRFAAAAQRSRTIANRDAQKARQSVEGGGDRPGTPTPPRSDAGDPAVLERLGIPLSFPGRSRLG